MEDSELLMDARGILGRVYYGEYGLADLIDPTLTLTEEVNLQAGRERAEEILRDNPDLLPLFWKPIADRGYLLDEYERMGRVILRTLEPLVQSGRIEIPLDPGYFAGFACVVMESF